MDYRRVELAKFVEHGRPWAANGPKLQKKRVLCIRSEHLRLQASQELTFTFKDAGRTEHTGRHSLERRAASATRATAARGAGVQGIISDHRGETTLQIMLTPNWSTPQTIYI